MMHPLRIYVVAHKPCDIVSDGVLYPIHVGRRVSKYIDEMAWMQGDDTGDNISQKNSQYCEMTAHYWIWKNVHDTEYVGICHYRRFFGLDITEDNIKDVLADYDVILIEPSYFVDSVYSYFAKYIGAENMTILSMVMKKLCPEYFKTLEEICDGIKFYPFNMLLCRKTLFDEYCEWMFNVLEECEKFIMPSPYTNAGRALAYMAEMLTGVFFIHHNYRIKTTPYYLVENNQRKLISHNEKELENYTNLESLLQNEMADKVRMYRNEKFNNPAILIGLKKDDIVI